MAETKTREQIEKEWWDAWWGEDYSWEGLARKPIGKNGATVHGGLHGEKTLQDYWRRDPATGALRDDAALCAAGELLDAEGVVFHIAHLPPQAKSGALTWKADLNAAAWNTLESLVTARVGAGAETGFDSRFDVGGQEGRAQLQGAVLRSAAAHPQGADALQWVCLDRAVWLRGSDFANTQFGHGARFDHAAFCGDARFNDARFLGYAGFEGAVFLADGRFQGATFSGNARFHNAVFCKEARFHNTTFQQDVRFNSATFHGYARFYGVAFGAEARFDSALFIGHASFYGSAFTGNAGFDSAKFSGDARFGSATFSGDAGFGSAAFSGNARFDSATFVGVTRFGGAVFHEEARFDGASISGHADFSQAKFLGDAHFRNGKCEEAGQLRFDGSAFSGRADFRTWLFAGMVYFDDVRFAGDMDFSAAVFNKLASFERIGWPVDARHWHQAFDQALFRGTLVLSGAGFQSFAAFDGATLERGVQIDDADEASAKKTFRFEKLKALEASLQDGKTFEETENARRKDADGDKASSVSRAEIRAHVTRQREQRLKQLERGCRVLKQSMEKASNKSREQLLYRFELQARRAQKGLPPGEALFSDLYGATSDYGASMVRPFVTLLVLIAAFGAAFFGVGLALGDIGAAQAQIAPETAALQAFDLSWANVFKPLSALTTDGLGDGTLGHRLLTGDPLVGSLVRIAATVQSLLAIVLAFLFALSVRRRFQIT